MTGIPLNWFLYVAAGLFSFGLIMTLMKKNAVMVLMGIELMLNATTLNLAAFAQYDLVPTNGQLFALFVIVIAAAEAAVALAIVLRIHRHYGTVNLDSSSQLKG